MLITVQNIQKLQTGFRSHFDAAWRSTPTWGERIATTVPSTTRTNTYGWMQRLLAMKKWDGPRTIQNLKTHAYLLENEPYEVTVGVDKHDIADDQLGVYTPMFAELGRVGRKWPDQTLKAAILAGKTALGFDGVPYFSDSHPLDPAGLQANLFTSTGLDATNFGAVRAAMTAYTGEDGEPLGVRPNLLIVPPQLEDDAHTIVTAERGASGSTNVQRGQAEVLVVPELADEDDVWYLADVSSPIKPLIWQLREAIQLATLTNVTDENVFLLRQFLYGLEGRGVAGYGPWFLMARCES